MVVYLLHAGTPLPAESEVYSFGTAVHGQREIQIEIWEQSGFRKKKTSDTIISSPLQ
jgi:hypothetical protein